MKYQYGYEYHTDNSQKRSKYKNYLTRNLETKCSTAKTWSEQPKASHLEGQPHLRNLTPVHKGCYPKLIPHSHWEKMTEIDVCFSQ